MAYQDGGNIVATYARGSATAKNKSNWNGVAHAGGLIGYHKNGEIKSSYSEADSTAEATGTSFSQPTLNAGGLVGTQDGGAITASYSVGTPTTIKGSVTNATENKGGLTGNHSSGTTHQLLLGHHHLRHHNRRPGHGQDHHGTQNPHRLRHRQ